MSALQSLVRADAAMPQSPALTGADGGPALRLFWFHHAGGSARNYRPWQPLLPSDWDAVFVDYPGRGAPDVRPLERRMAALARIVLDGMAPLLDRPYALFGHSMGSLVALEVARLAARHGLPPPLWLGASGRRAPQRAPRFPFQLHRLSDGALTEALRTMGGMPAPQLPDSPEHARFLHTLRADLEVCETYQVRPGGCLACPVTAYHGIDDATVARDEAEAWAELTSGAFRLRCFEGGHFYLAGRRREVVAAIVADIRQALRDADLSPTFANRDHRHEPYHGAGANPRAGC